MSAFVERAIQRHNAAMRLVGERPSGIAEDLQIADMVEYLGYGPSSEDPHELRHLYRCKNLQPNGDCGIYERRPAMCRDYPYDHPCRIPECTWEEGRCRNAPPHEQLVAQLQRVTGTGPPETAADDGILERLLALLPRDPETACSE